MAQRSARARSKLDKLTQYSGPQATPHPNSAPASTVGVAAATSPVTINPYRGIPGSTSFNPTTGLLTPSASSIATGSSGYSSAQPPHPKGGAGGGRHGFAFYNKNGAAARKSALRSIIEGQSEKIRGRLEEALRNRRSASGNPGGNHALGSGSGRLGDIREDTIVVKRWDIGAGKGGVQEWDKLHKDPELWQSGGDTLVYLCPQGHPSHQYSKPSFRVKSSVLLDTESPFFRAILTEINAPAAAVPQRTMPPSNTQRPLTPSSLPGSPMSVTFESLDQLDRRSSLTGGNVVSPTISNTSSVSVEGIKYAVYFPAPVGDREQTHKYHLTTRNVFAVLFGRALVGVTLGEALVDLVRRLDVYIPPTVQGNSPLVESSTMAKKRKNRLLDTEGKGGNVGRVLEYFLNREFDDLRNCPEVAAGVLVFAEKFQLCELWREAFCHCVGMLNLMEGGKGYHEITPITKALVDRASLEIQVRTGFADSRLASFQYDDMWPTSSLNFSPSKIAFERFQKFLIKHYQARFGAWPPPPQRDSSTGSTWSFGLGSGGGGTVGAFSRQIYIQLQKDFAALYDYLVDKDVSWEYPLTGNSSPSSSVGAGASTSTLGTISGGTDLKNKPKLVSPSKRHFRADDDNLPVTDILIVFDRRHDFPHIPHPYPLVPEMKSGNVFRHSTSGLAGIQNAVHHHSKPGFLGKRSIGPNSNTLPSTAMAAMDKAAALALSESTNIQSLLSRTASNELVDAFAKHEKERGNGEFTPAEGRKGRWILIYGVLQTLATVAGDAPGLKYTEGVEYFLSSKLKGTPPWVSGNTPIDEGQGNIDDHHTRSHCWTVMSTWDIRRNSYVTSDSQPQVRLTPKVSSTSVNSASTKGTIYGNNPATLRSIGVGVGDTTDTEAGCHGHTRVLGGRKRKAIQKITQNEAANINKSPARNRLGESLSGDEGDDEADEDEEDVVMGDVRDVPPLERDIEGELDASH